MTPKQKLFFACLLIGCFNNHKTWYLKKYGAKSEIIDLSDYNTKCKLLSDIQPRHLSFGSVLEDKEPANATRHIVYFKVH